jgi:endonuclease/exonuclease/phosphatase (EEP) superfamily protein YafD
MRSRVIVAILLVSIIVSMPLMGFNVPWSQLSGRNPTGTPFRVMTINMHYNKGDPKPLEDLIVATAPDIVAVQEWQGYERTTIRTTPGWHVHATPGQFLASRYPIKKTVELGRNSMGENASVAHYELDTPVGTVNVFNLHTATSRDGIHDTIHENPKGTAEIRANSALRREQSMFVAGKAAECKGPLLIVGDFNTPCESTIFADVWSGYTDAFTATGWGWGYTFRGAKTTVRIDHILSGKGWTCTACRVGPYVGSPHRPVIAEMVWTGDIFTESP